MTADGRQMRKRTYTYYYCDGCGHASTRKKDIQECEKNHKEWNAVYELLPLGHDNNFGCQTHGPECENDDCTWNLTINCVDCGGLLWDEDDVVPSGAHISGIERPLLGTGEKTFGGWRCADCYEVLINKVLKMLEKEKKTPKKKTKRIKNRKS